MNLYNIIYKISITTKIIQANDLQYKISKIRSKKNEKDVVVECQKDEDTIVILHIYAQKSQYIERTIKQAELLSQDPTYNFLRVLNKINCQLNDVDVTMIETEYYIESLQNILLQITILDKKMLILQLLISMNKLIENNVLISPKLSDVAVSFTEQGIANTCIKLWETTEAQSTTVCYEALVKFITDIFENWKVYDYELQSLQQKCVTPDFNLSYYLHENIVLRPVEAEDPASFYILYRSLYNE